MHWKHCWYGILVYLQFPVTVIASDINFYIHVYMQKKIIYEFEFDL